MLGDLPTSITINGEEWDIRTHFQDILKIIVAFNDPNVDNAEKIFICLRILFISFDEMPESDYEQAFRAALHFIDCEMPESKKKSNNARTMDWEHDESILFPAINKIAGCEVRSLPYLHWWTFMGYFMEISTDGVFGNVLRLRQKKRNKKTPLDKAEKDFWAANRELCEIKPKLSDDDRAAKERLKQLLK